MNLLDWIILGLVALFAASGYLAGVIVSGLALGGFALGAFAGSRIGPELLSGGSASPYAPLAALLGGIVIGALIASVAEGVGHVVRARLVRHRPLAAVDGLGGAVLLAGFGLALAWLAGAVALNTPALDSARRDVQRSTVLGWLNERLPPTGPVLNVLNRIDPTPSVPGPPVDVGPPARGTAGDPDVVAAGRSVVRVHGTACGLGIAGSGWVVRPGLVATNAHVVAGEEDTTVISRDNGTELDAVAVHYNPRNDLALLAVDGLDLPPLSVASGAEPGADAAVLGYPHNGPFAGSPARVGTTQQVISQDSYGRGPVRRRMTSFRGRVVSGNSGGPLVGSDGAVVGTVFAATTSGSRGGLAVPNEVLNRALRRVSGEVDTGPCAA